MACVSKNFQKEQESISGRGDWIGWNMLIDKAETAEGLVVVKINKVLYACRVQLNRRVNYTVTTFIDKQISTIERN